MGLDGVELVMAVEEAFDIQITDGDAAKMLTPRQVIDFVLGKVTTTTASVCLTQRAFNVLRKSLLRHGEWKRRDIAPAVTLAFLIPKPKRRVFLEQITVELGIKKTPEFVRARWLNILLVVGSLLAGLLAAVAYGHVLQSLVIWIFVGVAIGTAGIALRLTKSLCQEFPPKLQTVGDFSRWVMTHKSDLATASVPTWTRDQVEARVREIIVDTLGCKPDFSLDANFVKDLGLS